MEFNRSTRKHNETATFQLFNPNLYKTDAKGNTLLHIAARMGNLEQLDTLFKMVPGIIEKKNKYGSTPLHYATWFGQLQSVNYLVQHGADLRTKDKDDKTLLHAASSNGHLDLVKFFFESRRDVFLENLESKDKDGNTPLLSAAQGKHLETVKWLIEKNANISAENNNGNTILSFAAEAAEPADLGIVKFLANEKRINLSAFKDKEGSTLLHLAVLHNSNLPYSNSPDIRPFVQELLGHEVNIDINAKDNEGNTPLHIAAEWANANLAQYLINQGANVKAKNNSGKTPLDFAKSELSGGHDSNIIRRYSDIIRFLEEKSDTSHLHSVRDQYRPEENENLSVTDKELFSPSNLITEASSNQTKPTHRRKKKSRHISKPPAVTPHNPFGMGELNDSLNSLGNTSAVFSYNPSWAGVSPFNLSSMSERGLTANLETNNSNVSTSTGPLFLAGNAFFNPRKKQGTTPVGDNETLSRDVGIILATETNPSNATFK